MTVNGCNFAVEPPTGLRVPWIYHEPFSIMSTLKQTMRSKTTILNLFSDNRAAKLDNLTFFFGVLHRGNLPAPGRAPHMELRLPAPGEPSVFVQGKGVHLNVVDGLDFDSEIIGLQNSSLFVNQLKIR